jgi:hypothetical protein
MDKEISLSALQGCEVPEVAYVNVDKVIKQEHKPLEEN